MQRQKLDGLNQYITDAVHSIAEIMWGLCGAKLFFTARYYFSTEVNCSLCLYRLGRCFFFFFADFGYLGCIGTNTSGPKQNF